MFRLILLSLAFFFVSVSCESLPAAKAYKQVQRFERELRDVDTRHFLMEVQAVFSGRELTELTEVIERKPLRCRPTYQQLLEKAERKVEEKFGFCKSKLLQVTREVCEKYIQVDMGYYLETISHRQLQDFLTKQRSLDEDEVEYDSKIKERINEIESEEAEVLLAEGEQLSDEVAIELVKKLKPDRFVFGLGYGRDLQRVFSSDREDCHVDDLEFLFGKVLSIITSGLATGLRGRGLGRINLYNLLENQYRVCNAENPKGIERLKIEPHDKIIDELLEEVVDEIDINRSDKSDVVLKKFAKVVAGIKSIAKKKAIDGKSFYLQYGRRLHEACVKVRASNKFAAAFFANTKSPKLKKQLLRPKQICHYVPNGYSEKMQVNDDWLIVELSDSTGFGVELGKRLGVAGQTLKVVHLPEEKIAKKLIKQFDSYYKEEGHDKPAKEVLASFLVKLKDLCVSYRLAGSSLIWMSEAGYPIKVGDKIKEIATISNMCEVLYSSSFDYLEKRLNENLKDGGQKCLDCDELKWATVKTSPES